MYLTSSNESEARNPGLGNTLIVVAQVVTAVQMVVEERYVSGKNIPALQAVGYEGFGVIILGLLLVPMYFPAVKGLVKLVADHTSKMRLTLLPDP